MTNSNRIDSDTIKTNTISMPEDFEGEIIGAVPITELEKLYKNLIEAAQDRESEDMYSNGKCYRNAANEVNTLIEEHKHD